MDANPHRSLAAVLIVRDEAARLPATLGALAPVVDELVVVDTGSADNTPALARECGARVYHYAWCDDFAAARNFALDQATADYVLVVDADEVVQDPATARKHLHAFAATQPAHAIGTVAVHSPAGPAPDAPVTVDYLQRFFQRGAYRFRGAIHEQPVPVAGEMAVGFTGVRVHHTGYAQAHDDPAHKAHRNKRLLRDAIARAPDDEYLHYQLGKAHYSLRDYAEAAGALQAALERVDFSDPARPTGREGAIARPILTDMVVTLAYALVNAGHLDDARALLETHERLGHPGVRRADFPHVLGYVLLMQGDLERAGAAYRGALEFGPDAEDVLGTGSFASHYHLGLLAEARQDLAQAAAHYAEALRTKPDYRPALARVADLVVEQRAVLRDAVQPHADATAFRAVYLEKLQTALTGGNVDAVRALTEGAAAFSSTLLADCRKALETFVHENGG